MLSVSRIGAGDGYRYLIDQVASQDAPRHGENLASYYDRPGMPPGRWVGTGAEGFGLAGEQVDEDTMGRLLGRCEHPTEVTVNPETGSVIPKTLGRKMAVYRGVDERIADRLAALPEGERQERREAIVEEERNRGTSQAVTGFDLTFSAPKSVSVAWGLGNDQVRDELRAAHEAAWRQAMTHLEAEVASTRLGRAGVVQTGTQGLTAAAFEHWFSRAGDPQLHTHVAVSAMVQTGDGRWRRLDSRGLYRAAASVGERYTGALMAEVEQRLGWGWEHRSTARGTPVPELAGIDHELVGEFSTRGAQTDANLARLVADFRAERGVEPSRAEVARLAQQAVLEGRPDPSQKSWTDQQVEWRRRAAGRLGVSDDQVADQLAERLRAGSGGDGRPAVTDVAVPPAARDGWRRQPGPDGPGALGVAARVVASLEDTSATWTTNDINRAAARELRQAGWRVDEESIVAVRQAVADHPSSVALTVPAGRLPAGLAGATVGDRQAGLGRVGEDLWSSRRVLDGEARLHDLAATVPERTTTVGRAHEALAGTDARIATLTRQRQALLDEAGAGRREEDRLRREAATVAEATPGRADAEADSRQTEAVATRMAGLVDQAKKNGKRRRGRAAEEAGAELDRLRAEHPEAAAPVAVRADRARAAIAAGEARDRAAVEDLTTRADTVAAGALRAERAAIATGRDLDEVTRQRDRLAAAVETASSAGIDPELDGEQRAAVARLADFDRPVDALIGPAGAGKTKTLAAFAGTATSSGRDMLGLAPTAAAAAVLGEELGVPTETLDKALLSWQNGQHLPAAGTVVLIDEASMAATPKLVAAIDTVTQAGGVVRLAGDPRQLTAVGAGGGLGIVATAAASPRLNTLHRFRHDWEGPATLRLRDRDPAVLHDYAQAGRVTGGGRHAMLAETFEAWASAEGEALMIAGNNDTVRALSAMARRHRVEVGQVTEDGVALGDGSVAGVGDLVATRRNDRTIPVGGRPDTGGYVRNRDRWTVTATGDDGSLTVRHTRTGSTAVLPAEYVTEHVELGYATNAHGAQGATVDEAHVMVTPADHASLLYVGMTRGRDTNQAHVVMEDLDDEPGHLQPEYGSPVDVLAQALSHDEAGTATDQAVTEAARETDPQVLVARYQAVVDEDRRARLARTCEAVGSEILDNDRAWEILESAERLERFGGDPCRIVADLGPDATVDAVARAMTHAEPAARAEHGQAPLVAGLVRPPSVLADPEAGLWASEAGDRLNQLRDSETDRLTTGQSPPWAAALGQRPTDPIAAREWSTNAAQVALYRRTAAVTTLDPLGPRLPASHPLAPARKAASDALSAAQRTASDQPGPTPPSVAQRPVEQPTWDPSVPPPGINP